MKKATGLFLAIVSLLLLAGCARQNPVGKMDWWKEAKFGMFIHWGLYSIPAGEWNGVKTKIGETTEWIQCYMKLPVSEYRRLAGNFNPTQFNADDFVLTAKDAGMKYIVLTSKHHEGFAMFKSADPFNVVDATPYKKDIVKALADACRRHGMHFGLYYSQAQDWNHPGGAACSGHWDPAQDGSFDRYLDEVAVPQINEILTNYRPEILWWDTPCEMTKERAEKFAPILARYPNLIVNNRLCPGMDGDLETPEQFIPATGYPGKNWESCMTMNTTWGYSSWDHNWKSPELLVRNLIDIASKGGNYLLNVGPTSAGLIPGESVDRLKEIGTWMKTNGEAIYGTSASPFKKLDWGRCTVKKRDGKTLLYLHVFEFPQDGILWVPGLHNPVEKAYSLRNRDLDLPVEKTDNYLKINVSKVERDNYATVIALETSHEPVVYNAPEISAEYSIFMDRAVFGIQSPTPGCTVRYTTDGTLPDSRSAVAGESNTVRAQATFTVKALCFLEDRPVSGPGEMTFTREEPVAAAGAGKGKSGLDCAVYEGSWGELPDFAALKPVKSGVVSRVDLSARVRKSDYGMVFRGYLEVPETGVYQFRLSSNDGSKLVVSGRTLSNDGLHALEGKTLDIALERGLHPLEVQYFQAGGGDALMLEWKSEGKDFELIGPEYYYLR